MCSDTLETTSAAAALELELEQQACPLSSVSRSRSRSPRSGSTTLETICETVTESACWIKSATDSLASGKRSPPAKVAVGRAAHTPASLAESLGALLVPSVSGGQELVMTLYALGELATDGAFSAAMIGPFEKELQAFNQHHLRDAGAVHLAMVLGAMAKLVQSGCRLKDHALEAATAAAACARYCDVLEADEEDACEVANDEVRAGDVLSDVLWGLAIVGRPLPAHELLERLAQRVADPTWLGSSSLHMIARALWGLAKLQSMGAEPLLPPDGCEWHDVCVGFLHRAESLGEPDEGALAMYTEALGRLSCEAGSCEADGSPVCLSGKMARRYLKKACFALG